MSTTDRSSLIPQDAFERGTREGTLGAEEELWLADPETFELASGAQEILASTEEGLFSGELIDCEIESNTGVHEQAAGVVGDLISRREELLRQTERLGRVLGTSGTHPIGDWRAQEIIDKPHYQRLKAKLGWLIRRNNTFSLHTHYAVNGREKAIYLYNRLREYVPHFLALSVNSPFWQGEYTEMQSSRALIFSRSIHRGGLPDPLESWNQYADHVDFLQRSGAIDTLSEVWWDVRPHPALGTIELRACDAQTSLQRNAALVSLTAALCDLLAAEYDSGDMRHIRPSREIEENKWSAQRYGLEDDFVDHETHESVATRKVLETFFDRLESHGNRDISGARLLLEEPTEADLQLEVWRETGSTLEVAKDLASRMNSSVSE